MNEEKDPMLAMMEKGILELKDQIRNLNKDRIKHCSNCKTELAKVTDEYSAVWFDETKGVYRFFAFCSADCQEELGSKPDIKEGIYRNELR